MKKLTSLLIGCSLALAGAAMAQPPDQQSTPTKKKQGAEKTHGAPAQPGANAGQPQERPAKQTGAVKQHGAVNQPGAANEPGAGKGRKTRANQESATAPGTETGVSGQPTGGATNEPGAAKGRKGRAKSETAAQTGTNVSGQPAVSATPGAEQPRKGMKGRGAAAKTSATPAATAAAAVSATPATAAATAAPSVSTAGQQNTGANVAGGTKKADPQKVQQVKQQAQQIKSQHTNFRAQPKPQQVPAVTFNQSRRIEGSDRWQGSQYEVFRSYRPERHDQGWYRSRYNRVELIGGGYYYWNNGYWYPAWGYNPSAEYYAYDGPIYVGQRAQPPDQVIADVQAELQQMGYYQGEVDGLLGPLTRQALTDYQADQGLATTAAIDQPTLDSLGLS
jgi:Putative peptidoglycan binding domain